MRPGRPGSQERRTPGRFDNSPTNLASGWSVHLPEDDAGRLVGLFVQIPLAERAPLPPGTYYVTDLTGCQVVEPGGRVLGRVRDVQGTGEATRGTSILVVDTPSGELLVPMAAEICREIDLEARKIVVVLPEGLGELNRE